MNKLYLDKKGQISAEFLFITFIVLIVMAGMLSLVSDGIGKTETSDVAKARVVGEKFAGAINAVYVAGSGYSANFTIPGGLTDPASTFSVNDGTDTVDVTFKGKTIKINVIPKYLTGFSITSSSTDKVVTIKNQNGTIKFT
ncbi:MAG TPA: class III signal peptide-containing protein [Methanobacterium sp.]|nr:class III signal peptide-containing protein [Methanobacterium sp.]